MTGQPRTSGAFTGVDAHAHVLDRAAPLVAERHSAPSRDATVDEYLALLDASGLSHAVLTAPSFYGPNNSLLLRALATAPDRLRGTATVESSTTREDLERLAAGGMIGIRFNWVRRVQLPVLDTPQWRRVLRDVRDLGWHVEVYLESPKLPPVLALLRDCGVTTVLDHFGSPDPALGVKCPGFQDVLRGVRAGEIYAKLSGPYRLGGVDVRPYADALLEAGPRQLVWASDWPFVSFETRVTYAQTRAWLDEWVPDEATRRMILTDTPHRLFFG
jgi:predicted TIM-barrel fold metal-dependent hydrolase